jgi:hypothetical protein
MADVIDINSARSAREYAALYVRLGWWVLPLDPGTKKPLGKLVHNGFHDATNDAETATRWWTQHPDAGIGIALKKSGLVAVDIDPRNGGIETIDQLEQIHGAIVSDVLAYTGGGGEHRVFAASLVEGLPGKLGEGVDLKADGYIAVEPTLHPSGHRYAWEASSDPLEGVVPSTLPAWIRDLGRGAHVSTLTSTVSAAPPIDPRRLASALEALQHIASDDRDIWVKVGAAIHNEMPTQEGFSLWDAWSQTSNKYDAQDALRVWRSFHRKGLAGLGLNSVFKMAQETGWKNDGGGGVEHKGLAAAKPQLPILDLQQLEATAQSITWSVKHIIPADSVGVMFGGSGTFKSFLALDYALHVAHGLPWLGKKTKQGTVLFIAAEGGAGLWRRIQAWHAQRNLSPRKIKFYVLPVAVTLATEAVRVVEAAQALNVEPAVVIVDTMSQTFDGEENSANEVSAYLRELGNRFRSLWHCVVLVIHHSGHSATERPRGSSAIRANVDFMLGVFRDEKQMLATVECHKQKDGELFDAVTFTLTSLVLGKDEDGESITSLSAKVVNNAEELLAAVSGEAKAGRGGRNDALMRLVQNGMLEKELRRAFYEVLGDVKDMDAKKVAFYRAKDWAVKAGFIEIGSASGSTERRVIVLKEYT